MHTFDRNTIRDIQAFLILCPGVDCTQLIGDGVWGKNSRRALVSWQIKQDLPPTGEFDVPTIRALDGTHFYLPVRGQITTREIKASLLFGDVPVQDDFVVDNELDAPTVQMLRAFCVSLLHNTEGFYLPENPTDRELLCALVNSRGIESLEIDTSQITDFTQLGAAGAAALTQFYMTAQRAHTDLSTTVFTLDL